MTPPGRSAVLLLLVFAFWSSVALASAYRAPTATEDAAIEEVIDNASIAGRARAISEIKVADQGGWATAITTEQFEGKPVVREAILQETVAGGWNVAEETETGNPNFSIYYCVSASSALHSLEVPNVVALDLGFQRCEPDRAARIAVIYNPYFDDAAAIRPRTLLLDPEEDFRMKDLVWTEWGPEIARGVATAWRSVCSWVHCPDIATASAQVVLTRPVQCQEEYENAYEGPKVFSRLEWRLAKPLLGGIAPRGAVSMLSGPSAGPCRPHPL